MKKTKKTYGVSGMMEYQAVIRIGKATMKVPFTDGSMTAMGVNPATFTTEDFMTQHAIEHSSVWTPGPAASGSGGWTKQARRTGTNPS